LLKNNAEPLQQKITADFYLRLFAVCTVSRN